MSSARRLSLASLVLLAAGLLSASTSTNAAGAWTYRKKLGAGKYRLKASTAAASGYKAAVEAGRR